MEELRQKLHTAMEAQFHKELSNSLARVHDAIAPYTRFVRAEQEKTSQMRLSLDHLNQQVLEIRGEIDRLKA